MNMDELKGDFYEHKIELQLANSVQGIRKLIYTFFYDLGYRSIIEKDHETILFKRGSLLGPCTCNPLKWKNEITISIKPTGKKLIYHSILKF